MKLFRILQRSSLSVIFDTISYFYIKSVVGNISKIEFFLRGIRMTSIINLIVIGRPIISLSIGSYVSIGRGVILMSSSRFCLSSVLYAPCKIKTIFSSAVIQINDGTSLNGTSIVCRSTKISIGARTMIGPNVTIFDSPFHPKWPLSNRNNYPGKELDEAVEIGEDVWIGAQVIILPGSIIGSGSIIGAGSIVNGVVEPNCLAVGSPAKMVKYLGN
uniref:hypothetical protein n=1 Tax=Algoriphagus sp. TaxID=1872435 RepID=UPI00404747C6